MENYIPTSQLGLYQGQLMQKWLEVQFYDRVEKPGGVGQARRVTATRETGKYLWLPVEDLPEEEVNYIHWS